MRLRVLMFGAGLLALAACGQQQPAEAPAAPTAPAATTEAAAPAATPSAEDAEKLAALPAPYNLANLENGKKQFAKCAACHAAGPGAPNRVGPSLHGLFGRKAGTAEGFVYSDAVKNAGFVWEPKHLDEWLTDPRGYLPGNRMSFIGIKNPDDRRDVIGYLAIESSREK
jgi:cytochrome c